MWQDGSNRCDNTVTELTWLGGSFRNINVSSETTATDLVQTLLMVPTWCLWRQRCGSNVKTTSTAEDKTWIGSNGRAAERRHQDGSDSDDSDSNLVCGRGYGKTSATEVATRWQIKLGLKVALATEMSEVRR